jgi:hypothetical protein
MRTASAIRLTISSALALLLPSLATAQDPVQLSCTGQIESSQDSKRQTQQSAVDVTLDLKAKTIRISKMWGCVLDMDHQDPPSGVSTCAGPLAVEADEREVSYVGERTTDKYHARTSLLVSRYSGNMTVRSVVIALPASRAIWTNFLLTATYVCTPQNRRF